MNQTISKLLKNKPLWLCSQSDSSTIVLSTRIRLARNLFNYSFPHRCSKEARQNIISEVINAAKNIDVLKNASLFEVGNLDEIEKQILVECHLVSKEFVQQKLPAAILISSDKTYAIMINEEDHIRLQVLLPSLNLEKAWELMNKLDDEFEKQLRFAFTPRCGYLTSCPTNVGTGLRASVMLHLPALVHDHKIGGVISAVGKVGIAVRGPYGENSESKGNLFQISNQVTLGKSENDIVHQLHKIVLRIIEHETKLREALINKEPYQIKNEVGRAYGTLKYAEILSSDEAANLLSTILMGIDLHVFNGINRSIINELLVDIQPAHLQEICGKKLNNKMRDIERAKIIRKRLQE